MRQFSLGGFSNQLSIEDQNRAAQRVASLDPQTAAVRQAARQNVLGSLGGDMSGGGYADPRATRTLGAIGQNAVRGNPYAEGMGAVGDKAVATNPYAGPQQQRAGGWDKTQRYLGAAANLQSSNSDGQKNGLQKVLGLVSLFK